MLNLLDSAVVPSGSSQVSQGRTTSSSQVSSPSAPDRAPVKVTLGEPLIDRLNTLQKNFEVTLQKGFESIQHYQDEHEQSLRQFIREELHLHHSSSLHRQLTPAESSGSTELQKGMADVWKKIGRLEEMVNKVAATSYSSDLASVDAKSLEESESKVTAATHSPDLALVDSERLEEIVRRVIATSRLPDLVSVDAERLEEIVRKATGATGATHLDDFASIDAELKDKSKFQGQGRLGRNDTVTPEVWKIFQEVQGNTGSCMYKAVLDRKLAKRSVWHQLFQDCGCSRVLRMQMPQNRLARWTEHPVFITFQTLLILSNTCLIGYEADVSVKAVLQEPKEEIPEWLDTCNSVFNIVFSIELLLRIIILRSWFWVAPNDWGWNVFDVLLVISSLASDLLTGVNLNFIRTFRVLRAIRVARLIRVLRFFRNLRRMLFAILACISSLAWAFVFLAMVMFMFSILFVQGAVHVLDDAQAEDVLARTKIQVWFGSLADAMLSLLATVTGGASWLEIREPLSHAGQLYAVAYVIYMLFVTVGVMNVLTGVFLTNANEFVDLSLIVHAEQTRIDAFVEQLLELFNTLDESHTGEVDWPTFDQVLRDDHVRAYFSSLELEPTHVRLIFNLLDQQGTGKITIDDLVMGMVRLKGEAKAIDARIIQREIGMLPLFFRNFRDYLVNKLLTPGNDLSGNDLSTTDV